MMNIEIVSLFPEMFSGMLSSSITKRALENKLLQVNITNPRDYAYNKHNQVDDTAYGGGAGMVMKPEPLFRSVEAIKQARPVRHSRTILMCPTGIPFTQQKAKELADYEQLIFICGHYEGFDHRVVKYLADEAISIGDYVLTGGELPAMVVVDAVSRMIPGVLGSQESAETDSFYRGLLEYPQYTKPREYLGMEVPAVLLSGDHAKIAAWRHREALRITYCNRPDLLQTIELSEKDRHFLEQIKAELQST